MSRTADSDKTYSKKTQHRIPSLGHNLAGRHQQPSALPRGDICGDIVSSVTSRDIGRGTAVEVQLGDIRVNHAAGDEVICGSERDAVATLCVAKLWDSE